MKEATLPLGPPPGPAWTSAGVPCVPLRAHAGLWGSLQEPLSVRKNLRHGDSSCSCLRRTLEQGREGCTGAGQQGQAGRGLIGSSLLLLPCVLASEVVATGSEP